MDILKFLAIELISDKIGKYLTNKLTVDDINVKSDFISIDNISIDVDEISKIESIGKLFDLYDMKPEIIYCESMFIAIDYIKNGNNNNIIPPMTLKNLIIVINTKYYIDNILSSIYTSDISMENIEDLAFNKIKLENSGIFGDDDAIINAISQLFEHVLLNLKLNIETLSIIFHSETSLPFQIRFDIYKLRIENCDTNRNKKILCSPKIIISYGLDKNIHNITNTKFTSIGHITNIRLKISFDKTSLSNDDLSKSSYVEFQEFNINIKTICDIAKLNIDIKSDFIKLLTDHYQNKYVKSTASLNLIEKSSYVHSLKQKRIRKELIRKYNIIQRFNVGLINISYDDKYEVICRKLALSTTPTDLHILIDLLEINIPNVIPLINISNSDTDINTIVKIKCNLLKLNLKSDNDFIQFKITNSKISKNKSLISFIIDDFDIIDGIKKSQWNKFLCKDIKKIKENSVEDDNSFLTMCYDYQKELLSIKLAPIRLFVHQFTLAYLVKFVRESYERYQQNSKDNHTSFITISKLFKHIIIDKIVLTIDYKPVKFNTTEYSEMINLLPLQNFYIELEPINKRKCSLQEIIDIWSDSLSSTIIYKYLRSIMVVNSVMTMLEGFGDLFIVPYEEYMNGEDGIYDVVNGVSNGIWMFIDKLSQGCIDILSRVTISMNSAMEYGMLPLHQYVDNSAKPKPRSKFSDQPTNIGEGIVGAYQNITEELVDTGNIVILPFQKETLTECITSMTATVPIIVLKPISASLLSISKILLGIKNNINPKHKLEMDNKYG